MTPIKVKTILCLNYLEMVVMGKLKFIKISLFIDNNLLIFSDVYLAKDKANNRLVAVKMIEILNSKNGLNEVIYPFL